MTIPAIAGTIARRMLVNYRADPSVVQARLPALFRPKLHAGQAIIGVCLIRLEKIRPAACKWRVGIRSENAAHRIAVEWGENGAMREGVFIPRRDTSSLVNHLAGGHLFPGQYQHARFTSRETASHIDFHMRSVDRQVEVRVVADIASSLPTTSIFTSLSQASAFFEGGCYGYSSRCDSDQLDGMVLQTKSWHVDALAVEQLFSSYFGDEALFPKGSVEFDHALLMRDIPHEWHAVAPPPTVAQVLVV